MTAHVPIDSAELRRQHEAHKARAARFFVEPEVPKGPAQKVVRGKDANAHVHKWKAIMARPVDMDLMFLEDKMRVDDIAWQHVAAVKHIVSMVAEFYNVSVRDILSQRRSLDVVRPRQIAMYLARTLTIRSLPEIGRIIGGRDHTTILHGVRKITWEKSSDEKLAADIAHLTKCLLSSAHADA